VLEVLKEIGAGNHPMLTVYNKADLLAPGEAEELVSDDILVSAATGEGLESLVSEIVHQVSPARV
jgi:50S ribosomal subunit-associated GTPase HflX